MDNEEAPTIDSALAIAEKAIRNGDYHVGRAALLWILKTDRRNVPARLWYAYITENHSAKITLYRQVLELDPQNETAKKALAKYGAPPAPVAVSAAPHPSEVPGDQVAPITELEVVSPTEPTEDEIVVKLEKSKTDLLDMGMRNKLLNYRTLKSKGAEVIDEKSDEVFRILVTEGRSMSFEPVEEDENDLSGAQSKLEVEDEQQSLAQPEEPGDADLGRHTDNKLQTPYTSKVLQRRLLNSYHAANTYIQEQGVNILFIAIGFLRWYEDESSSEPRRAPLILVPVALSRSSVKAKFRIKYTEEDLVENLSLRAKLSGEFGISLPELPQQDLDPPKYFAAVKKALRAYKRWEVSEDAIALGFFSYGKFLMFNDLQLDEWPEELQPYEHPILRGLLHDGFDDELDYLDDEIQIDEILHPDEVHQVVNADSSQILAIHDVNRGSNLVIEGPPGTGKSQTITNLIAEAIGNRKTVLFVSEKMAALEVVKRRLDEIGLGDACLELHSQKTKKKLVLEELERSLSLGRPTNEINVDIALLKRNQDRLNGYSYAVNSEIGESGHTAYEVYGRLIDLGQALDGLSLPELKVDGIENWSRSEFREAKGISNELQILLKKTGRPKDHPFWGSRVSRYFPGDKNRLVSALAASSASLTELSEGASLFVKCFKSASIGTALEARSQIERAEYFSGMPDISGVQVQSDYWVADNDQLRDILETGIRISAVRERYGSYIKEDAWDEDVSTLDATLQDYRRKFWRGLSPGYREASRQLAEYLKAEPPKPLEAKLALVRAIHERNRLLRQLRNFDEQGRALFGARWQGEESNWDELVEIASWLSATHQKMASGELDDGVQDFINSSPNWPTLSERISHLKDALDKHEESINYLISLVKLNEAIRFGKTGTFFDQEFEFQARIIELWTRENDRLQEIVNLGALAKQLTAKKLDRLIQISIEWPQASEHLSDLLELCWLTSLLERAMSEHSPLATFDGQLHENSIGEFCELDRRLLTRNRIRLVYEHWKDLPKHRAGGQLGLLRREFAKRRRHLPIRQLILGAGKAIQAIKPVFMMSPLSIAKYLVPGSIYFDLVVFDEASQVKPVDAFGAILRGRQLVVVGDEKQLPPTTFFETAIDVDEDYSGSATIDIESILGMCRSKGIRDRMLKWHYRSQHESLITVSNNEFYDHKLVIFPSPDKGRTEVGLAYHHLPETSYDRGGSRKNVGEAKEVALAVMRHAENTPHLTLGVATFSHSQREAVLDQLELLRNQHPATEEFFASHPEEPFFVKNLENVQGDERDIIFISVGYGRQIDGRVAMNFGPLNHDGGERRLNVLITRARKRCEVFTNLQPGDIDLSKTRARGVRVLKQFLNYAATGELDLPIVSEREPDSPFELAVASALRGRGHRVDHQVGTGGFFIDLAIVHPDHPGSYLLGIECDGAMYHSARSARDRDRIRQEVLEDLGWKIHRIWSTDWFRNPSKELDRAEQSIAASMRAWTAGADGHSSRDRSQTAQATRIERSEDHSQKQSAVKVSAYKMAELHNAAYKERLHEVPARTMAEWIAQVVDVESPVHSDEVARRIANSAGVKRLGARIRAAYDRGQSAASRKGAVKKKGAFLWRPGARKPKIRTRANLPNVSRKLEMVAPEEIELAIVEVIRTSFGIPREDLASDVCTLFGFRRVTKSMRPIINKAVARLLKIGKVLEKNGSLELPE